jgi:hypothetical protein
MRDSWPTAVARRIGLGGSIDFTTTRVGQTLHIPCRGNGRNHLPHIVDVPIKPGQNPEAIAKKLLHDGWKIGHRLLCANSCKKKREEPAMAGITLEPQPPEEQPAPTPTPAAGRARRLVYMALEEDYDEVKKAYRPGKSDAGIAKECGVAEALVKTIREESYGPLAVPSELDALRRLVEQFRKDAAAAHEAAVNAAVELERKITAVCKRNNWQ